MFRIFSAAVAVTAVLAGFGCRTTPEAAPAAPDPVLAEGRLEVGDQTISSFKSSTFATIENPRAEALILERVTYSLAARGRTFREGSHALSATVPPMGRTEIEVPVAVEYSLSVDEHQEVFSDDAVPLVFNGMIVGRFAGGEEVGIPLDRAGRMRTPRLPAVSLATPDGARRRTDEVHATFRLQVSNDNPFELRLAWVDYVLEVDGNELRESRVGTGQRIPPSGAYQFIIEQDLRTANVPALEARMRETGAIGYRIHGEMRVGDLVLPFDETDEIRFAGQ